MPATTRIGADGHAYAADDTVITRGSTHYRNWADDHGGRPYGPIPAGMTEETVGNNAVAVIRLTGKAKDLNSRAYEVGVIPRVDTQTGEVTYSLAHDPFAGGYGLESYIGETKTDVTGTKVLEAHGDLLMYYQMMSAKAAAEEAGHDITFEKQSDGTYVGIADTASVGVPA